MLSDRRHAFWKAFLVAVLIFSLGLVLGVYLEQLRSDESNLSFYNSEVSLYDSYALSSLIDSRSISCNQLNNVIIDFADKIYYESLVLEEYDSANKITESSKIVHRKYDVLRTIYWINVMNLKKKCGDINTVVYLYDYESEDISTVASQITWSRVLKDLKDERGNDFVLIPIAADQEILSLDVLVKDLGVESFPAIVINEKDILYTPVSSQELEKYLDN
jgi:hypothetical protein